MPEGWPQINTLVEVNPLEKVPVNSTGKTHRELQEAREAEEEEEEEEDEEEEEEEDEDEEGEEGEEGEGDEDEDEEEEEEEDAGGIPDEQVPHRPFGNRYFLHNETLTKKFNEVELDSFMKLLNIKPHVQWQDQSTHHYRVGMKAYEDESQMLDPYFHLVAEVERKYMERQQVYNFRRGTEVKINIDKNKVPQYPGRDL